MSKFCNLLGRQFNSWIVIKRGQNTKKGSAQWICRCVCGNSSLVQANALKYNHSKQCQACASSKGYGEISGTYWSHIKKGARERGLEFVISIEDTWQKFLAQNRRCILSGVELGFVRSYEKDARLQTASLDRIDSNFGYLPSNIQWLHKHVNMMKSNHSMKYFTQLCKIIAEHTGR